MVNKLTGRAIREEATVGKTFDLVRWIRVRKIQWIGYILRMDEECKLMRAIDLNVSGKNVTFEGNYTSLDTQRVDSP